MDRRREGGMELSGCVDGGTDGDTWVDGFACGGRG